MKFFFKKKISSKIYINIVSKHDQTKLVKEINAKISNHEIIKEKLLNITLSGYFAQRTLR